MISKSCSQVQNCLEFLQKITLLKKSRFQKSKGAKKEKAKKGRKKKIVPTFRSAKNDMKWRKMYVFVPLPLSEKKELERHATSFVPTNHVLARLPLAIREK
jgi:hypothetical protein